MDKNTQLLNLKRQEEKEFSLPLRATSSHLVFGEGNPNAEIYFLGEAPGKMEDLTGRPFIGPAGKLLEQLLANIGLKREEVFISSVLHYRPPKNRDPQPEEITAFAPFVDQQIKIINPKIIITLGRFSLNKFFPDKKISQVHGQTFQIKYQGQSYLLIPMYHPAAGLRSKEVLEKLKQDFQVIPLALKNL